MAANQSRLGFVCSASRTNSSPLPKPSCRGLTSPSSCLKLCRSLSRKNTGSFPTKTQIVRATGVKMGSLSDLLLRRWRGGWQSPRSRGSAAAGIAAAGENGPREVIRQPQFSRGDKNQKYRVLIRILPPAEHITRDGEISEDRQARDRAGLFRIGDPAHHGRFVLVDANSLRQRAIRNEGHVGLAGARQGADFEFEQQSNFIVGRSEERRV